MSNEDFVKELGKKYEEIISKRKDSDYRINEANWAKLLSVVDYLSNAAEKLGGRLEPVVLIPREQHGYVEAIFDVFDIEKSSIKAFTEAVRLVDVFSIEPTADDKVSIGVNINYVYEKK